MRTNSGHGSAEHLRVCVRYVVGKVWSFKCLNAYQRRDLASNHL